MQLKEKKLSEFDWHLTCNAVEKCTFFHLILQENRAGINRLDWLKQVKAHIFA